MLKKAGFGRNDSWKNQTISEILTPYASILNVEDIDKTSLLVSLRKAFVASDSCMIIAADYSQLELRILAHMSQDSTLLQILGPDNPDVFKAIAAKWKKKPVTDIDQSERTQVKQIAYGILYGISSKALSEQLEISQDEAFEFMTSFMDTYPGVQR